MGIKRHNILRTTTQSERRTGISLSALRCRRKFLRFFSNGFQDEKYYQWERGYKWRTHEEWNRLLDPDSFRSLLREDRFAEIAARAIKIESKTNLLFSFVTRIAAAEYDFPFQYQSRPAMETYAGCDLKCRSNGFGLAGFPNLEEVFVTQPRVARLRATLGKGQKFSNLEEVVSPTPFHLSRPWPQPLRGWNIYGR